MSKEHEEIWEFVLSLSYSEEENESLYETLTKEGFYTVAKLRDTITSEDDLKQIGISQFEKRRKIYSVIRKNLDDDDGPSYSGMENSTSSLELKINTNEKSEKKKKEKKDVRDTVENLKKLGSKIGRGAISRLFYALALVKKRMIEYGMEGSIEAELEVAMFIYNIEVEINNENNSIEEEVKYLKEIENSDSQGGEVLDKEMAKSKEAKFSFIKKAISKFLESFRDHMTFMAEKMNKKNMAGTVGIGAGIGLGPIGSISIKPKIEIKTLMEWSKKNKELIKQRQNGSMTARLIGGKELKKDNCQVVFRIGEQKRESGHLRTNNPQWNETFDSMPCAPAGDELLIQILHKNKNIGKKLIEEIFVNVEKMRFENGVPKTVDFPLVSKGSLQVEFTFSGIDVSNFDGVLKIEAIEGKKLAKKDISGKSDPYLIFFPGKIKSNKVNTKDKTLIKTKYINQTLNPTWNETVNLGIPSVKEGFTIFCYDYDMTGDHDFMGKVFVPLAGIKNGEVVEKWLDLDLEGKIRVKWTYTANSK